MEVHTRDTDNASTMDNAKNGNTWHSVIIEGQYEQCEQREKRERPKWEYEGCKRHVEYGPYEHVGTRAIRRR
jgi:hypothetical protein